MSSLTSWEAPLVNLLDNFHSATNPLDSNFQNAVHDFQSITKALLGSGPEAFQGQAASALEQAVGICLARDQALIDANVLGQGAKASTDFAQKINEATSLAASFITDETVLAEVLSAMSIFQAAQYGAAAIPQGVISAVANKVNHPSHAPGAGLAARNAGQTLAALEGMADNIHNAVSPWEQALAGDVSSHAALWKTVQEVWNKAESLFEILKQLVHNDRFQSFADSLEKDKGSYIAALGFLLTMLANPPKDQNEFMRELYGAGLSWGAAFVPGLDVATVILEGIHQFGPVVASGQDAVATALSRDFKDPQLLAELQYTATGMREGADKIEVGSFFNDLGAFIYDGSTYSQIYGSQSGRQAQLQDLRNLGRDTWHIIDGTWQFSTNLVGGGLDDLTALALGKNEPGVANVVIQGINTGTHWVASAPDKLLHGAEDLINDIF